jgi:hypothetical protein
MNNLSIIILIVVAVLGGYIVGLLDSRFTRSLLGRIKKIKDDGVLLKVSNGEQGKLVVEFMNRPIKALDALSAEDKANFTRVISFLNDLLGVEKPIEQKTATIEQAATGEVGQTPIGGSVPTVLLGEPAIKPVRRPLTLVEMINEEINKRIVGTGLEMTLIKLVTRPDDSIYYCVGSDKFEDLEQITNKEARDLIKKTIKEWQASKN